jgi:ApbE superfamily uncharacterized protein (UPF0280 family)
MYQPKTYRHWVASADLVSINVTVKETDIFISAKSDLTREARRLVIEYRSEIEEHIRRQPQFLHALKPLELSGDAAPIIREMVQAATKVGVGPMAAVAGAIAEFVGAGLAALSDEIIVENGGDIYLHSSKDRVVGIYAGTSPLSGIIGLKIKAIDTPLGICTSSGTVGHSLSFGCADAVVAISPQTALADTAATAIANIIQSADDIADGIEYGRSVDGILGVAIVKGDKLGIWGDVNICPIS